MGLNRRHVIFPVPSDLLNFGNHLFGFLLRARRKLSRLILPGGKDLYTGLLRFQLPKHSGRWF